MLRPCRWVHTVGMAFPIDVAFVDAEGIVVKVVRMGRWRVGAPTPKAAWVIEAAAGAFERWGLAVGDQVEVRLDHEANPTDPRDASAPITQPDDGGRAVG